MEDADARPTKTKQVYTLRDFVNQHHQDLISSEIPYKPTDREYIGSYQRAVTKVMQNMSKEDLREAERILALWNTQGPPSDVQLK